MAAISAITSLSLITSTYSQVSSYYPDTTTCVYGDVDSNYVTYCDLNNTLRGQILEKFENYDTFIDLIGKLIRLEFHDCFGPKEGGQTVSICDGCIDYNNADHAGLVAGAIDKIDNIYTKGENAGGYNWDMRMSRADFWAAVSTIALQESTWLDGDASWRDVPTSMQYPNNELPYIPFYIGREDCSGSPETAIDTTKEFPSAILGWGPNFALFNDATSGFDLNAREYICLLGAHGLGRVIKGNSGFGVEVGSPWTFDWDVAGNAFYSQLLDDGTRTERLNEWVQQERELGDGIYEWVGDPNTQRFRMLNSDMALLLNIDNKINSNTGRITQCTYDTCPKNSNRHSIIQEYANDNQLWLDEFAAVWDKMIRTGYDKSTLNPSDLSVLAEDWYYTTNNVDIPSFTAECVSIVTYTSDMDPTGQAAGTYGSFGRITNRRISLAVESTIAAFVADSNYDSCDKNLDFLTYYYGYTYNANGNKMVTTDTRICCGAEAAGFAASYSPPAGYSLVGTGAAFADFDDDGDIDDDDLVKQIIVFSICGLLLCLIIGGGIYLYMRYRKNKQVKTELKTAGSLAENTPRKEQDNIETVSPSAISPSV